MLRFSNAILDWLTGQRITDMSFLIAKGLHWFRVLELSSYRSEPRNTRRSMGSSDIWRGTVLEYCVISRAGTVPRTRNTPFKRHPIHSWYVYIDYWLARVFDERLRSILSKDQDINSRRRRSDNWRLMARVKHLMRLQIAWTASKLPFGVAWRKCFRKNIAATRLIEGKFRHCRLTLKQDAELFKQRKGAPLYFRIDPRAYFYCDSRNEKGKEQEMLVSCVSTLIDPIARCRCCA